MKQSLMALAVAGALAAPGLAAAQSTVEIYGRANVGVDTYKATGSTVAGASFKSRARVFDQGSRLGFRVNESLGGGLRAFVVIESGVNIDTGSQAGQSGAANANTGFWASRDSYVGLGGDWGDVRLGRQSPWYSNGIIAQAGSNYINTSADNAFLQHGAVAFVNGRTSNVMSYNTPTIGGFNASLSWAPNGTSGPSTESGSFTGTGQEKESLWALTGRYTTGALRAQFDWGSRRNVGFVDNTDNNGWKAGLGWAYAPGSQISFIIGRLENKNITAPLIAGVMGAAGDDPKVRINIANWEHMLGQWQLIAQYSWSGKVQGLSVDPGNTRVKAYTLAAKYFLSKRTGVYASFNGIRNEENAWSDFTVAGMSSGPLAAANRGADPRIMALGILHNF